MRRLRKTVFLTGVVLLLVPLVSIAASDDFPLGTVIDPVVCRDRPDQTYALYLPSGYTATTPLPILYCFDPGGRGRVPVELYKAAAERLGYIVVCSNNSRNGPWDPILAAIQAVWADTHARLAIDQRRVYTSGMSGGGGPAWTLASSAGAAGAIVCASVMDAREDALKNVTFSFFGIAGLADFNYRSMRSHCDTLLRFGKPVRFETFEGGHGWPPEELCAAALDWTELQAMRSGVRARDDGFIASQFSRAVQRARDLEDKGDTLRAFRTWRSVCLDFEGLQDVSEFRRKVEVLSQGKALKDAERREEQLDAAQEQRTQRLLELRALLESPPPRASVFDADDSNLVQVETELHRTISDLKKRSTRELFDREKIVAQRVIEGFFIGSFYQARELMQRKDYQRALVVLGVCSEIRPEAPAVLYDLARAHAARKDRKRALDYLERAVSAGFKDARGAKAAVEFANLSGNPRFEELIAKMGR